MAASLIYDCHPPESAMSAGAPVDVDNEIPPLNLFVQDGKKLMQVEQVLSGLILTPKTMEKIRKTFIAELENGLNEQPSSLQMENTYISDLPDGTEEGKFLALDLGGTNFKILLAELKKGMIRNPVVQHYHISDELRLGSGTDLFDHIADCLCDFLKSQKLSSTRISLGFTFSFPIAQHSLDSATLVRWTKTFNCQDIVGSDVMQLLRTSLIKKGCRNVSVDAILNDTTGTLLAGVLEDSQTSIGLVIGTGSNACYLEKADKVKHWEAVRRGEKEVIIDTEWGGLGDNGVLSFLKTEFDVEVDNNSLLVNSFTFEKYVSGKYLGELVRVILVKLVKQGLLFDGRLPDALNTPKAFPSEFVSQIEEDVVHGKVSNTTEMLRWLGVPNCSEDDAKLVQFVGRVVVSRSATLVSICLSILIDRIDRKEVTIAVTGSVYEKHPTYRLILHKYIQLMTQKKFKIIQVTDGSGKGAAVLVAVAQKIKNNFNDT